MYAFDTEKITYTYTHAILLKTATFPKPQSLADSATLRLLPTSTSAFRRIASKPIRVPIHILRQIVQLEITAEFLQTLNRSIVLRYQEIRTHIKIS